MSTPFIDRRLELRVLDREYSKPGFSFIVVYGRRRIGKTRLLREWLKGKKGVHYIAAQLSYEQLCREFSEVVGSELGLWVPFDVVEALERISSELDKVVVVLDEFQYLVEADPSLPSRLSRSIDSTLSKTSLKLVICGSAVSFFEKELLAYRAPLFGRRTAELRLGLLRFLEAMDFTWKLSVKDSLLAYSVLGGTPAYLASAYGKSSVEEVVEEALEPGGYLETEAEDLLRQELREPSSYMSILKAVAEGRTRPYEAAQAAGVDPRTVHHYLRVLEELDIVRLRKPLGQRRGTRVFIIDDYFRFWFTYTTRLRSLAHSGLLGKAVEAVMRTINSYASQTFEQVVEQLLPELHQVGAVPTKPVEHGPWWKGRVEVDLVVRDPGSSSTFIEAKWSALTLSEAKRELARLEAKAAQTGLLSPSNYYVIVAREVVDADEPVLHVDDRYLVVDFTRVVSAIKDARESKLERR